MDWFFLGFVFNKNLLATGTGVIWSVIAKLLGFVENQGNLDKNLTKMAEKCRKLIENHEKYVKIDLKYMNKFLKISSKIGWRIDGDAKKKCKKSIKIYEIMLKNSRNCTKAHIK